MNSLKKFSNSEFGEKPAPAAELKERATEIPNTPFLTCDISGVGHRKRDRSMDKIKTEVKTALAALGCKGKVRLRTSDRQIIRIYIDGKYWGRYDMSKHTFVD